MAKPNETMTAKVQVAQQQIRDAVKSATAVTGDAIERWKKKLEAIEQERSQPRRVSGFHPAARGR